ncbi:NADH-quinone oxidoreductase subunit NuoN [Halapricum sp. CBA1109]|uniref:NADH-quinone oxidoreductase subunit N n=1 Tax=Halapricum sp. CBA1109 TaxID=2668068 RepID=UPI0012F93AB3|nr:NADH-quinone oxidoreductase subunit N [Halapricum sp. CBA1109]MUV88690.1 NADH-quinone oxidoreductase subunit NuoN [Halapricum sp. CBA1109]
MTGATLLELPEYAAVAPAVIMIVTALLLLVIDSISPEPGENDRLALNAVAIVGAVTALSVSAWFLVAGTGQTEGPISLFEGALVVDGMALFFSIIVSSVTVLVLLAGYDYAAGDRYQAEYQTLVFLAASGMILLGMANSFVAAFLSLELASLPSYALVAYLKHNRGSVEAGLKYFLVGALSSAVMLYGISLVYGVTGTFQFAAVAEAIADTGLVGILGVGIVMIVGGVAFKTASVPFHFWAPEAYEGAPAPVSAFISSASKAAGFVLAFRLFVTAFPIGVVEGVVDWTLLFLVLSIVTMTLGNFAAATQENVKRMLAYSSVGHAGYVLIALASVTTGSDGYALGAGMAHLLVYGFMNTGAFLFIALTEYWDVGRTFEDFNGLGWEAPVACVAMTVFMFSLAGLPLGGGFVSKYILFGAAVRSGLWWLAVIAAINSALSLYYYSRVVKAMWIDDPEGSFEIESYPVGIYAAIVIAAVVTVLLLPGFGLVSEHASAAASALV